MQKLMAPEFLSGKPCHAGMLAALVKLGLLGHAQLPPQGGSSIPLWQMLWRWAGWSVCCAGVQLLCDEQQARQVHSPCHCRLQLPAAAAATVPGACTATQFSQAGQAATPEMRAPLLEHGHERCQDPSCIDWCCMHGQTTGAACTEQARCTASLKAQLETQPDTGRRRARWARMRFRLCTRPQLAAQASSVRQNQRPGCAAWSAALGWALILNLPLLACTTLTVQAAARCPSTLCQGSHLLHTSVHCLQAGQGLLSDSCAPGSQSGSKQQQALRTRQRSGGCTCSHSGCTSAGSMHASRSSSS